MSLNKTHPPEYAERYSQWKLKGTRYLAFRDVPRLIKEHIHGDIALDFGCGPGNSTEFLQSLNLSVDGVDIDKAMIKYARTKLPDVDFNLIHDRIPVMDGYYDLVFASWVFVHTASISELIKIFSEINRGLKPSGTFMTIVNHADYYNEDWVCMNTKFEENKHLKDGNLVKVMFKDFNLTIDHYYWSDDVYRKAMKEAGFRVVQIHRPKGTQDDGYEWITEKYKSPFTIYVAKKMNSVI